MTRTATRPFAGTWRLIRLAARRDRIILPVWIVSIVGIAWMVIGSYEATVGVEEERISTATFAAGNPMARLFDGPAAGHDLGAMVMVECYLVLAVLAALMSSQAVVRHTRQDEETGRAELIGSAVVGRHARLTAALVVALAADVVLGAAVAAVLIGSDFVVAGSLVAGLSVMGIGWVFAGVGAVSAQVFGTARGANAIAGMAFGIAFLLRAVGDLLGDVAPNGVAVVSEWPSWLSPIGWGQQMRAFYLDRWWITGLFAGLTLVLVAVAVALEGRRDVGPGMVPARSGPAHASPGLRSAVGLAWRLQRGIFFTWLLGLVVMGAALGPMGESASELIGENEQMRELFERLSPGADVVDLYFAFSMAIFGIAAAGYTIQALLRMRAEEVTGRLEPVLATATGRHQWLAGHVIIATAGTTLILTATGVTSAVTYAAAAGDWSVMGDPLGGAMVQLPAALALGGFVLALFGLLPRLSGPLAWASLALALVVGQLGTLLDLPQWVLNISPFTHVPLVPADPFAATPVVWLSVAALALGALGFAAFRRRDLSIGA
jgi:ABC-2 type transport system permease protein